MPRPGEPLWLAEDRWWALALQALEADSCKSCGVSLSISTSIDGEDAFDAEPVTCHGCRMAASRVKVLQDQGSRMEGVQMRVWRREKRWGSP